MKPGSIDFPRFRLRTLMIGVALAGVVLGLAVEVSRLARVAEGHRVRSALLAVEESSSLSQVERCDALIRSVAALGSSDAFRWKAEELRIESEPARRRLDYVRTMRRKYERAASRPWEAVAPDLPEPR